MILYKYATHVNEKLSSVLKTLQRNDPHRSLQKTRAQIVQHIILYNSWYHLNTPYNDSTNLSLTVWSSKKKIAFLARYVPSQALALVFSVEQQMQHPQRYQADTRNGVSRCDSRWGHTDDSELHICL
jgi:hypothetical protein